jgi:hypothetical protein
MRNGASLQWTTRQSSEAEAALKLVHLNAEKQSLKYERAAMKWLRRYLDEGEPTLKSFAKVVRNLEQRQVEYTQRSWSRAGNPSVP